jgi:hypothetical protein
MVSLARYCHDNQNVSVMVSVKRYLNGVPAPC